ncbi:MAG: methyltransferase domain-containing protein [Anaerolineae bacterium]
MENLQLAHRYLSGFEVGEQYRAERDAYLDAHLRRLLITQQMMPCLSAEDRVLELGAAPYLMTLLLRHSGKFDLYTADYRGDGCSAEFSVLLHNPASGESCMLVCQNFNVEKDRFPYPDEFFDGLLCCELLEHLASDPTHMLMEAHRVLRGGGWILITTPNVLVLRNLTTLAIKRKNIYAPYSGYGVYGRHNREWTLEEVVQLLKGCGFCIETAQQVDTYPHPFLSAALKKLFPHLRDMIFILARTGNECTAYYPENLYTAMHN